MSHFRAGPRPATASHSSLRTPDKHNQIFVLDMAGGESQQLTKSQTSIQQFAWKPDGTAIAFAAADAPPKKTGADKFDDAFEVGNGSFLDKDKALPTHLWLIPATGGEAKRLTSGAWTLPVAFPPGPPASPIAFTPDGNKLVYVRLENTYSGDRRNSSPQVLDLASGKSEPITTHTMYSTQPLPSPDGSHLAYIYPRDGTDRNYQDIYVVDGLKGDGDNITHAIDRNFFRALWMPDSKSILTGANDGATASLWIQPLTGNATKLDLGGVTPNTGFWLDATVGNQGQIAFVGTEPHRPSEIYILDTPQSKPRRLTTFHAAFDSLNLGKSEVVTWQSPDKAPKNWTENGILTYPPDYTHHAVRVARVEVGKQLVQRPGARPLAGVGPVDVVPQHIGLVTLDQVSHVQPGVDVVRRVVGSQGQHVPVRGDRRQVGDAPVQTAGVVHAETQAGRPDRFGDLANQIATRTAMNGVPRTGAGRVPQRDAVVMLRGRNHVRGAGFGEQRSPRPPGRTSPPSTGRGSRRRVRRGRRRGGVARRGCRGSGSC